MRVMTLIDNHVSGTGLLAEHGLAVLIDTGDERILFDTGQGMALAHNCQQLGVDLRQITKIVLSHGHYDHTGGLRTVLGAVGTVDIYAHPDVFQAKYHRTDKATRYIGTPFSAAVLEGWGGRLHLQRESVEIARGVWLTGEIPRKTSFESVSETFHVLDGDTFTPDNLWDDQSLILEGEDGITLQLGCAHAGVVNTLQAVEVLRPSTPVVRILGGTHLIRADETRLQATAAAFQARPLVEVGTSHCTGHRALHFLQQTLGEVLKPNDVGTQREL